MPALVPLQYHICWSDLGMLFYEVYLLALAFILGMMTILWIISTFIRNVSIVDLFWGASYVLAAIIYFIYGNGFYERKILLLILVAIWGLRLSIYLMWRNAGKGEDFRYKEFRRKFGEHRYWWFSFFQTFLLQGILAWLISAPILAAMHYGEAMTFNVFDILGLVLWSIGFIFEFGGDMQLAKFKSDPANKGKVLNTGFWRYTRHPNYFGDAAVWWGFGFFAVAGGSYFTFLGSLLMTFLLVKVSGVALLEKSLKDKKSEYQDYIRKTSAFFPWFPKK